MKYLLSGGTNWSRTTAAPRALSGRNVQHFGVVWLPNCLACSRNKKADVSSGQCSQRQPKVRLLQETRPSRHKKTTAESFLTKSRLRHASSTCRCSADRRRASGHMYITYIYLSGRSGDGHQRHISLQLDAVQGFQRSIMTREKTCARYRSDTMENVVLPFVVAGGGDVVFIIKTLPFLAVLWPAITVGNYTAKFQLQFFVLLLPLQ
jgi:hypothetical protein